MDWPKQARHGALTLILGSATAWSSAAFAVVPVQEIPPMPALPLALSTSSTVLNLAAQLPRSTALVPYVPPLVADYERFRLAMVEPAGSLADVPHAHPADAERADAYRIAPSNSPTVGVLALPGVVPAARMQPVIPAPWREAVVISATPDARMAARTVGIPVPMVDASALHLSELAPAAGAAEAAPANTANTVPSPSVAALDSQLLPPLAPLPGGEAATGGAVANGTAAVDALALPAAPSAPPPDGIPPLPVAAMVPAAPAGAGKEDVPAPADAEKKALPSDQAKAQAPTATALPAMPPAAQDVAVPAAVSAAAPSPSVPSDLPPLPVDAAAAPSEPPPITAPVASDVAASVVPAAPAAEPASAQAQPAAPMPANAAQAEPSPAPAVGNLAAAAPLAPLPGASPSDMTPVGVPAAAAQPAPIVPETLEPLAKPSEASNTLPPTAKAPRNVSSDKILSQQEKKLAREVKRAASQARQSLSIARSKTPDERLSESESVIESHEDIGLSIQVKQPTLDAYYELEQAYAALMGGQTDVAILTYQRVLDAEPRNVDALFGLATTYHRVGQLARAKEVYTTLLAVAPDHRDGLNNFLMLLGEESPKEALERLKRLEVANPSYAPIPAQLAMLYERMGDLAAAVDAMARAAARAPDNLQYRYNLAVMLDKAGNWADATGMYKEILAAMDRGEKVGSTRDTIQQRLTFIMTNTQG